MSLHDDDGRRQGAPAALEVAEEPVDLSDLSWDDALVFIIFWTLAAVVFLQFFTRYVLNDSIGWTEEIARYLLIGVTFVGSVMAVRKSNHIAVEFFYRYLSPPAVRGLALVIDLTSVLLYLAFAYISHKVALRTNQMMVSLDLSKSLVYWVVAASFLAMGLYGIFAALRNWRRRKAGLAGPDIHITMD